MERRHFLKVALGFAAGAATLAAALPTQAAPLPPVPTGKLPTPDAPIEPAVAAQEDIDNLSPEQVRWRRRGFYRRRFYRPRC